MVHRWASPALGLVACALVALPASSQVPDQRAEGSHQRGVLGQNQPVGDPACETGTQRHVVTLRIYNILSQVVAVAALVDTAADSGRNQASVPRPLSNLALACGSYAGRWDGTHSHDGRQAAPGVYMYQLLIDGHPSGMKKMLLR